MKRFIWKKATFLLIVIGGSLPFIYYARFLPVGDDPDGRTVTNHFQFSTNLENFNRYLVKTNRKSNKSSFAIYSYSLDMSDKLGAFRTIPDTRDSNFRNEARSALLRTIVTILNRSPVDYLEEIILVDDYSDDASDGTELEFLPYIKIHRNTKREGLIRSRNIGADLASGDYLIFLDSHCEVNVGWLEPLLSRVSINPGVAVSPIVDTINAVTFQYKASYAYLKGGFDWNLRFKWIPMSNEEREKRKDEIFPFIAPAFSAGTFMISRKWFFQLGGFDSSLEIWGGESLEMSIKHWLCGGQIEVVPCSRVGHVFRKTYPYTFPDGIYYTHLKNSKRIAESWFDEYKHFFYSSKPAAHDVSVASNNNVKLLKKDLQCRPFSWYLMNIFPELKLPNEDHNAFGQVKCGSKCLGFRVKDQTVQMQDCGIEENSQWFLHAETGKLSSSTGACLNLNSNKVILEYCKATKNQMWLRKGGHLMHEETGLCLENTLVNAVGGTECRQGAPSQLFSFSIELQRL